VSGRRDRSPGGHRQKAASIDRQGNVHGWWQLAALPPQFVEDTEGTPVKLGSPDIDQIEQGIPKRALFGGRAELKEFLPDQEMLNSSSNVDSWYSFWISFYLIVQASGAPQWTNLD
jgi:hypothetical protein